MESSSEEPKSEIVKPAGAPTRPKGKIVWAVVIILILVVAAVAGAWAAGLFGGEKGEKVLVIAMSSDVETMNPAQTSAMYGPPGMIYETLIARDMTGAYVPGLAESWNLNRDDPANPTLELTLKEGVKYHDGTPFNSESVKRTIEWYSQNDSWVSYEFWSIKHCPSYWDTTDYSGWPDSGIWCKDDYHMVLNLTWADVALIFNLSHLYGSMIGPDALWELGVEDYGTVQNWRKVVGTGPFMISEWVAGDHITLVKNENYTWGASWYDNKGPAKIDKIIYRIVPDAATRFAGFESGAIDILQQVPPNKVETYQDMDGVEVMTGPGQGIYHVEFNCQKAPWNNTDLRLAMAYSINRTQILQTVWHGIGEEGVNLLSPICPEGTAVPAQYNLTYDLAKATAHFTAAGFEDIDDDGMLENTTSHENLELALWVTNKAEDVAMGEILLTQFEAVGVDATMRQYQETELRTKAQDGLHEAILFWFSWPRAEILDWHFGSWAVGNSNTAYYADPIFDDYVVNWTLAETEDEFTDNATAAHIRLLENAPRAPILFWHQVFAIHDYVKGWYVHPLGQEQVINIVDVDIRK
ncbi:MAG: ABC transporter substrate-binding protein [Candidatus Thermoplasmatota archaeon]|nr:ABC transporter substrate-binding protein [Candidatus Thermoplasmatota archaeon]MBU1913905.1 ABC transporter substrate-binding protein [Candidatus Thermoplasmatota archaeon]